MITKYAVAAMKPLPDPAAQAHCHERGFDLDQRFSTQELANQFVRDAAGWVEPDSRVGPTEVEEIWMRTCTECSHRQVDGEPQNGMTNAYRNRKCRRCKSDSLDYGSTTYRPVKKPDAQ